MVEEDSLYHAPADKPNEAVEDEAVAILTAFFAPFGKGTRKEIAQAAEQAKGAQVKRVLGRVAEKAPE